MREAECAMRPRLHETLLDDFAKLHGAIPAARLRRENECAEVEPFLDKLGHDGLERFIRQRWLAGQDAPVAQRRMRRGNPAVVRIEGDDDRLASEGIPPDAEETDRGHLQYGRERWFERARA